MEQRIHYREQIRGIHQELLRMGVLVEENLNKALRAVKTQNRELASSVIDSDPRIDAMQLEIEERCTVAIATEQPVATDLREIMVAIKIASDLERIGDHARHLARALDRVSPELMSESFPVIESMAEIGIAMVHDSLDAYVDLDADRAREVALRDQQINVLHRDLYDRIISAMKKAPERVEEGTSLVFINRFMERLGDHVTNICEWIVYARTGEHPEL